MQKIVQFADTKVGGIIQQGKKKIRCSLARMIGRFSGMGWGGSNAQLTSIRLIQQNRCRLPTHEPCAGDWLVARAAAGYCIDTGMI